MEREVPRQILELAIVAAAGNALTVMATELDLAHPVAVMISVNV